MPTDKSRAKRRAAAHAVVNALYTAGCSKCGYRKCARALCFHHRDPGTKSYKVSELCKGNYSLRLLLEELAKCDLLCANCHAELHSAE